MMSFILKRYWLAFLMLLFSVNVFSQASLSSAEYFWDQDPGVGNGTVLNCQDGFFNEAVEKAIQSAISVPPSAGVHQFCIRFRDDVGTWGPIFKKTIINTPNARTSKIMAAEYFWGTTDPGFGAALPLIAFDGAIDEAVETVLEVPSLTGLSGVQLFTVRLKDEAGNWGPNFKKVVKIGTETRNIKVTAAEYFWGTTDPGQGAGTAILAFDGNFDEVIESLLDNSSPAMSISGPQLFNIRLRDEANAWGPLFKKVIAFGLGFRSITVNTAEYFWGTTDPGIGQGTPLVAFDGAYDEAIESAMVAAAVPSGLIGPQLFNVRLKDENNVWGPVFKKVIMIANSLRDMKITQAECFVGINDPGLGSGIPLIVFDGGFDETIETVLNNALSLPSLQGLQQFNIRLKDESGAWGPRFKKTLFFQDAPAEIHVDAAEYFWGTSDPGAGSGTPILAFDGNFNQVMESIYLSNLPSPGPGMRLFNLRLQDESGAWGPIWKKAIYLQVPANGFPVYASTSANGNAICYGGQTVLTASGAANYTWYPAAGLNVVNGSTVIANPQSTTTYTLTGTNANGIYGSTTITVVVNPTPQAEILGINTTCVGGSTLTASGGSTYLWNTGETSASIAVTPSVGTTYSVNVTQNGCSATATKFVIPVDTIQWTGAIDTDWHKPCNWNPQVVPQQCNSVVIPLTANQPIISQVAACKDIWIYTTNGAQLTVNNSANLQIETCPVAATEISCP
jgi:hypothetical protein